MDTATLQENYPQLGDLQIERILELHDKHCVWYDYCPNTHQVTMISENPAAAHIGYDITVTGLVLPTVNTFTTIRG